MSIHDELAALYAEFGDAFEKGDPDRLAELYTDDAVFLRNGTATVVGREQIRELFGDLSPSSERIAFEIGEVYEDGDLVVDIGGPFFVAQCGYPGSWAYFDANPMEA